MTRKLPQPILEANFTLEQICDKTCRRLCLLCDIKLDNELGEGRWHIPLCKKHRLIAFEEKING